MLQPSEQSGGCFVWSDMKNELDLLDGELNSEVRVLERPSFLTVLCILTFVGVGFAIISAIFGLFTMSLVEGMMRGLSDVSGNGDDFSQSIGNSYRWTKIIYLLSIAGSLFCLVGALFMWKLRKIGYFIYIIGQLIPLTGTVLSVGSTFSGIFAGLGMFSIILSMVFPVGFIIMYGLHLKYMKK